MRMTLKRRETRSGSSLSFRTIGTHKPTGVIFYSSWRVGYVW